MNVDKVAAMQGIGDLSQVDVDLRFAVRRLMSKLSKPGAIKRAEFDLNVFLVELAEIDFDNYDRRDVAELFKQLGESLESGLWVADHGFEEVK